MISARVYFCFFSLFSPARVQQTDENNGHSESDASVRTVVDQINTLLPFKQLMYQVNLLLL